MPQESQAIPLVSVASVAAGKAKRQVSCGSEDRLEKSLRPQEACDPGTALPEPEPGLPPSRGPVSVGGLGSRAQPFGEQIPSFMLL